jgi:hypothetical protein
MIKKLLLTLFLVLVQTVFFAQTNTYTGSNGDWNTATNWSLGIIPTASNEVVIPLGKTVNISSNSFAKSISVSGSLTISNAKLLTVGSDLVSGDFIVNLGGSFTMGSGNDLATLVVYGNYINNGLTDFWKSTVVITGDLLSPSTSELQKQGNVVVGGNIIGDFDLTGGSGSGQIYAVNPNATVTITPETLDNNVTPGVQVDELDPSLITLVNNVIYGGNCSFTISGTTNISTCTGTNAIFTVSTTGSSPLYQWEVNTGSGWSDLLNNAVYSGVNTTTLTVSNVTVGMNNYKFRARITVSSCAEKGNYGFLTVNTQPAFPTVTPTQPTCSLATGSIAITAVSGETYSVDGSIYSSTLVYSGLASGLHTVYAKNASGCTSLVTSVTINAQSTKTWNGTEWTPSAPMSNDNIVFAGTYPPAIDPNVDLVGCSCQVTGGAVTIKSDRTLTLTNALVVSGGSMTFENNASLVQINDAAVNSGVITYMRSNTTTKETDYTYWSSPVAGQTLKNASPNTLSDKYYSFDSVADDWKQEDSANVMSVGIGYIIRGPHYTSNPPPPPSFYEAPFIGVPNNGTITTPIGGLDSSNLIGNPYSSALDADKFLTDNNSVLDGTLYFWTHNTAIQLAANITNGSAGSGTYAYTSDDYASYNLTGGVGVQEGGTGNYVGTVEQIYNRPSGKIASGQAFFATGKATGNATFNNSMRVGVGGITGDNSQFFKINTSSKTTNAVEKHRVWLNLTNMQGAFKQMLVGYVSNATNEYDNAFDGESFDGNQFVDFYSVNADKNLTIQGRALPFDENDQVLLGYSSTIEGVFSITIDQVDGLLASQDIFIEDKNTNVVKNLKQGEYSFSSEAGTFNDRFVLRYINAIANKTLGTGAFDALENTVLVSNKNKQIKINSSVEAINKVQVYDLLGKSIYQKINADTNELAISNLVVNHQVLLVKIVLQNGKTVTKKIVY